MHRTYHSGRRSTGTRRREFGPLVVAAPPTGLLASAARPGGRVVPGQLEPLLQYPSLLRRERFPPPEEEPRSASFSTGTTTDSLHPRGHCSGGVTSGSVST